MVTPTSTDFLPYAKVYWYQELSAVRVSWLKLHMSLEEFQKIANYAFDVMQKNKGYIWIADMYESKGVFSPDVVAYISDEKTTAASAQAGLRWALTIKPKELGLASMSTKKWNQDVRDKTQFIMEDFADLESCMDWLKQEA